MELDIRGCRILKGWLDRAGQEALVEDVRAIAQAAPFHSPLTPWGKPMSVRMTAAGRFGWFTDRRGYRYIERHPSGALWPPIPDGILGVWRELVSRQREPDSCLVNYYGKGARMGLHQDRDEADFSWPVLSISLGDTATFRVGGLERGGSTESVRLESGDVAILGGAARLAHHGIDRILHGSSTLVRDGGRINLTLRVVT